MSLLRHHRERQRSCHAPVNREAEDRIKRMRAELRGGYRPAIKPQPDESATFDTRGVMFERPCFSAWQVMGARVIR